MKTVLIFALAIAHITSANAQNLSFDQDFTPIRTELTNWDPIRGEWLASSLVSMVSNQAVPDRTFPETLTPIEMLRMVPKTSVQQIQRIVAANQSAESDSTGTANHAQWSTIDNIVRRVDCTPSIARSSGDPHLVTFDDVHYDFQGVGEFVLLKSPSSQIEIQTRQQTRDNRVAFNTASAMNVGGDKVSIYAGSKPNMSNYSLFVNGEPQGITNSVYYLPTGGKISYARNTYTVSWPTGEIAKFEMRSVDDFKYMDITVQIFPCGSENFEGLFGNANGTMEDDAVSREQFIKERGYIFDDINQKKEETQRAEANKDYLDYLAKEWATSFLVSPETSMFDNSGGTDRANAGLTFNPLTLADLNPDKLAMARKTCLDFGITEGDMEGCIYDHAYLGIQPAPRPTFTSMTDGLTLVQLDNRIVNNNSTLAAIESKRPNNQITETPVQPIKKPNQKTALEKSERNAIISRGVMEIGARIAIGLLGRGSGMRSGGR